MEIRSLVDELHVKRCYKTSQQIHSIRCTHSLLIINFKTSLAVYRVNEEDISNTRERIHSSNYRPAHIKSLPVVYECSGVEVSTSVCAEQLAVSCGNSSISVYTMAPWTAQRQIVPPDWVRTILKVELTSLRTYAMCEDSHSRASLVAFNNETGHVMFKTELVTRWPRFHKIHACKPLDSVLISHCCMSRFVVLDGVTGAVRCARGRTISCTHCERQQLLVTYEMRGGGALCVCDMGGEVVSRVEHEKLCTAITANSHYLVTATTHNLNIWRLDRELLLLHQLPHNLMLFLHVTDQFIIAATVTRPVRILYIDFT